MQRLSMLVAALVLIVAAPALATQRDVVGGNPSVSAVHSHGNTVITFKGHRGRQLYRQIAGHEINLKCRSSQLGSVDTDAFIAPKHSAKLRAILEGDWCEVMLVRKHHKPKPIVAVAITPAGVPFLDERVRAVKVDLLVNQASFESASGRYPTAQQFLSEPRGDVIALGSPIDPVPLGKYGFYSDGAQHVEAVGVTAAGKRLFEDVNGESVFTNVLGYVGSLSFD